MIVALVSIVSTNARIGVFTIGTITDSIVECTSESTGADVGAQELPHATAGW